MIGTLKELENHKDVIGTSFFGNTINANVNELIKVLGIKPIEGFDDKTRFEWRMEYKSEMINKKFPFVIYDWREDWDNFVDCATGVNDYLYTTRIDWHIGGRSGDDTFLIKTELTNILNDLRNE